VRRHLLNSSPAIGRRHPTEQPLRGGKALRGRGAQLGGGALHALVLVVVARFEHAAGPAQVLDGDAEQGAGGFEEVAVGLGALTNSSGAIAATYAYDPYGNVLAVGGTATTPFLYAGQYRDAESGLYYMRARYYEPSTAQFLSRDPSLATTRAPYAYVSANPLNWTDPSGQDPWWEDTSDRLGTIGILSRLEAKIQDIINDPKDVFNTNPQSYAGHVESIEQLQLGLAKQARRLSNSDPTTYDALRARIRAAEDFDAAGLRGMPSVSPTPSPSPPPSDCGSGNGGGTPFTASYTAGCFPLLPGPAPAPFPEPVPFPELIPFPIDFVTSSGCDASV
jgi:RHS repeat-associated protein